MLFSSRVLTIIFLVIGWLFASVEAQQYNFRYYSSEDLINPLPGSTVHAIFQDSKGYMWYGVIGKGLVRYDGKEMILIDENTAGVNLNSIISMTETFDGRLWVYTTSGLFVSDNALSNYKHPHEIIFVNSIESNDELVPLYSGGTLAYGLDSFHLTDDKKRLYVATRGASIIRYSFDTSWSADTLKTYVNLPELEDQLKDVFSVTMRKNDELVFVSRNGYIGVFPSAERQNENPVPLVSRFYNPGQYGVHISLLEDANGQLWGGTTLGLIWRLTGNLADSILLGEDFIPEYYSRMEDSMVFQLQDDLYGNIWAATSNGLALLDYSNDKEAQHVSGTKTNPVNVLWRDIENNIWAGSYNGLYKFSRNYGAFTIAQNDKYPLSLNKSYNSVISHPNNPNIIWGGSNIGLFKITDTSLGYSFDLIDSRELQQETSIFDLEYDNQNRLWGASNNGFFVISNEPLSQFNTLNPRSFGQLSSGENFASWFSDVPPTNIRTFSVGVDEGVILNGLNFILVIYKGLVYRFKNPIGQDVTLNKVSIDENGYLWAGTLQKGLFKTVHSLDETIEISSFITNEYFQLELNEPIFDHITFNQNEILFNVSAPLFYDDKLIVSTGMGIQILASEDENNNDLQIIETITSDTGLLFNVVTGFSIDEDRGVLWTGGPNGINSIVLGTWEVGNSFSREDGLQDEFLMNSASIAMNGSNILYGTAKGLIIINPDRNIFIRDYPLIHLNEASINSGTFTASFTGIYFRDERNLQYKFRLLGFSEEWTQSTNNASFYTNLGAFLFPKSYRFEVASLAGNAESIAPAFFDFTVQPPFYATWWFIILVIGGFFVGGKYVLDKRTVAIREKESNLALMRQFEITQRIGSTIVHDIKNSVFSLDFLSRNLNKYFDDPEFREDAIETIQSTTSHLNGLISRIQEVPKSWDINLNTTKIAETIYQVVKLESYNIPPNISISSDISENIEWKHDSNAIQRVLQNLIRNSIEALGDMGVITVNGCLKNDFFILEVSDNGSGFDNNFVHENLFKPFKTTKEKGIGLGLYSVYELVKAHSGEISLKNYPHEGATFTMKFPIA